MTETMWPLSRREWLGRMGTGLGALGLAALLDQEARASANPLAANVDDEDDALDRAAMEFGTD